jgi:putative sugar O-methyltransferase
MTWSQEQISEDGDLLKLVLEDMNTADPLYRPTPYWQYYVDRFTKELGEKGLHDIRRRKNSWASSFTATDLLPPAPFEIEFNRIRLLSNKYTRRIPNWPILMIKLGRMISQMLCKLPYRMPWAMAVEDMQRLTWDSVELLARERGGRSLRETGTSLVGRPENAFPVGRHSYTMNFLTYFHRYAFVAKHIAFDDVRIYAELGPGLGGQAELLAKLYPEMSLLLFDIAPMIYVSEQYLKSVFGERVISYRQTRDLPEDFKPVPGKIYMFGAWHMPMLRRLPVDVFWNAFSLSEMEPRVMRNYLDCATATSRFIYLIQILGGANTKSGTGPKVDERIQWTDYETKLEGSYEIAERTPALSPMRPTTYLTDRPQYSNQAVWQQRA